MKLIACSVLLLVTLGESYCNTTTTVNQTSSSWGYDFSHTETSGYKVKHNQTGYHFEPMFNNPSTSIKKHYNSSSVYDQFTSPGSNTSVSQSNAMSNGTSNGNTDSRTNSTVLHKVPLDTSADVEHSTEFQTLPTVKTHSIIVTETQTDSPTKPNVISKAPLSPSQGTAFGNINGSPNVPASRPLNQATYAGPYGYRAPNSPMYYPQAPSYGQTYGSVGGSIYGIPNGQMIVPPSGPSYGSTYGQPTAPMNGYGPQNGQMYGPQNGQMYGPPNGQTYGPQNGQMYGLQNGQAYGPQNGQAYGPQNGQTYWPQNGQMYGPGNGPAYGYPAGSLYGSYRNY